MGRLVVFVVSVGVHATSGTRRTPFWMLCVLNELLSADRSLIGDTHLCCDPARGIGEDVKSGKVADIVFAEEAVSCLF
jgi:hypothetical protein